MPSYTKTLYKKKIAKPPKFVPDNVMYETITGSMAYGVSEASSDFDIIGFCIPPKDQIFPHLRGEIQGFSTPMKRFDQWQQHHMWDQSENRGRGREYDITMYSIVKYFRLCMECNPNMIDSLFTPHECVTFGTTISNMVRDKRDLFLSKKAWHTFKGYAYSQLHKMRTKLLDDTVKLEQFENDIHVSHETQLEWVRQERKFREAYPDLETNQLEMFEHLANQEFYQYADMFESVSERAKNRRLHGFDVKFAYHVVRLMDEADQIMSEGTIDLRRNREQLKAIRRGEVSMDDIHRIFSEQESRLAKVYESSKLRHKPDEAAIKQLLLDCLEHHYGSLEGTVQDEQRAIAKLRQIHEISGGF